MGCVSSVDIASPLKHQADLPHERVSLNNMLPPPAHEGHTIVPLTSTLPGMCRFVGVVEISGKQEPISCPEGSLKLDPASNTFYLDLPIISQSWVLQVYLGADPSQCDSLSVNVVARRQSTVYHLANAEVFVAALDTLRLVEDVTWILTAADKSQLSVSGSLAWRNAVAAGPGQ